MHLASWKRALGIDLISCRSQYHTVLYLSSVDSPSNGGVCWVFIAKSLWFFLFPSLACPPFWKFATESMCITWGYWSRTPGTEMFVSLGKEFDNVSWFVGFFPRLKREFEVIALRSGTKSGAVWPLYVVVARIFDACILVTIRSLFIVICRLGQQIWRR